MKKIKIVLITILLLITPSLYSMPETFKRVKMDRALMFLQQDRYNEALKEIIPLYKEEPSDDYLEIIAKATLELGLYERAKNFFTLFLEKNPENLEAIYHLGVTQFHLKNLNEAGKLLEASSSHPASQASSLFYLGLIYQEEGDRLKAVEYFKKAAEDPTLRIKAKYRAAVAVHEESLKDSKLLPLSKNLFQEAITLSKAEDRSLKESAQGYLLSIERREKNRENEQKTFVNAAIGSRFNTLPGYPGYPLLPLETYIPFKSTMNLNAGLNLDYLFRSNLLAKYSFFHQSELNFEDLDWQRHEAGLIYNTKSDVYGLQGQVAFTDQNDISFLSQRTTIWGEWETGELDKSNASFILPLSFFFINEDKLIGNQPLGDGLLVHPRFTLAFDSDGHKLATVFLGRGYLSPQAINTFADGGGMLTYKSPKYGLLSIDGETGTRFRYFMSSSRGKELDAWSKIGVNLSLLKWMGINMGAEWNRRYADIDSENFDEIAFMVSMFLNPFTKTDKNYVQPNFPQ